MFSDMPIDFVSIKQEFSAPSAWPIAGDFLPRQLEAHCLDAALHAKRGLLNGEPRAGVGLFYGRRLTHFPFSLFQFTYPSTHAPVALFAVYPFPTQVHIGAEAAQGALILRTFLHIRRSRDSLGSPGSQSGPHRATAQGFGVDTRGF